MDIRILPGNIANMIAAGEVVQRPASVVKELMENAVDAGATQVTVILTDAGRTLIQVIDNGCGMTPDEAVLCFERHATSKIATAEDLNDITTFGFRGEALASIAAVAEVTLKTRRPGDEVGYAPEAHSTWPFPFLSPPFSLFLRPILAPAPPFLGPISALPSHTAPLWGLFLRL